MRLQRWFLPETPDVIGLLRRQVRIVIEGLDAFTAWARGDTAAAEVVRETEHRGDVAKRELLNALRAAFVTPMEPEDAFALSRGLDWVINHARDIITESEVMAVGPDEGIAEMGSLLAQALRHIDEAIASFPSDSERASAAADAALRSERRLEGVYYRGMAALLEVTDMRERISRRELYRRCSRIGETVVEVAERVVYATVKES